MFDQLSERLQGTMSDLRSRGKLSEADVDKAMREIRLALLEADVNFKVTKQFVADVREQRDRRGRAREPRTRARWSSRSSTSSSPS